MGDLGQRRRRNLSATTVAAAAKCALGNWPTYTAVLREGEQKVGRGPGGHQPSTIFRSSRRRRVPRYSFHLISVGVPLNAPRCVQEHRAVLFFFSFFFLQGYFCEPVSLIIIVEFEPWAPPAGGRLCAAPAAQWAQLSSAVTEAPSARVSVSPRSFSFVPPPSPLFNHPVLFIFTPSSPLFFPLFLFLISLSHQTVSGLVAGAAARCSVL